MSEQQQQQQQPLLASSAASGRGSGEELLLPFHIQFKVSPSHPPLSQFRWSWPGLAQACRSSPTAPAVDDYGGAGLFVANSLLARIGNELAFQGRVHATGYARHSGSYYVLCYMSQKDGHELLSLELPWDVRLVPDLSKAKQRDGDDADERKTDATTTASSAATTAQAATSTTTETTATTTTTTTKTTKQASSSSSSTTTTTPAAQLVVGNSSTQLRRTDSTDSTQFRDRLSSVENEEEKLALLTDITFRVTSIGPLTALNMFALSLPPDTCPQAPHCIQAADEWLSGLQEDHRIDLSINHVNDLTLLKESFTGVIQLRLWKIQNELVIFFVPHRPGSVSTQQVLSTNHQLVPNSSQSSLSDGPTSHDTTLAGHGSGQNAEETRSRQNTHSSSLTVNVEQVPSTGRVVIGSNTVIVTSADSSTTSIRRRHTKSKDPDSISAAASSAADHSTSSTTAAGAVGGADSSSAAALTAGSTDGSRHASPRDISGNTGGSARHSRAGSKSRGAATAAAGGGGNGGIARAEDAQYISPRPKPSISASKFKSSASKYVHLHDYEGHMHGVEMFDKHRAHAKRKRQAALSKAKVYKYSKYRLPIATILRNKVAVKFLKDFVDNEMSSENLLFWLAAEKHRLCVTREQLAASFQDIWDKFLNPRAHLQLTLDHATMEAMADVLARFNRERHGSPPLEMSPANSSNNNGNNNNNNSNNSNNNNNSNNDNKNSGNDDAPATIQIEFKQQAAVAANQQSPPSQQRSITGAPLNAAAAAAAATASTATATETNTAVEPASAGARTTTATTTTPEASSTIPIGGGSVIAEMDEIEEESSPFSPFVFSRAQFIVRKELKHDIHSRFVGSDEYRKMWARLSVDLHRLHLTHTRKPVPMNELMDNPIGCEALRTFMAEDKTIGPIDLHHHFYIKCRIFRKRPLSRRERRTIAKYMFRRYFGADATQPISIPPKQLQDIRDNLDRPSATIFDAALDTVTRHMEERVYPAFLKSEVYSSMRKEIEVVDASVSRQERLASSANSGRSGGRRRSTSLTSSAGVMLEPGSRDREKSSLRVIAAAEEKSMTPRGSRLGTPDEAPLPTDIPILSMQKILDNYTMTEGMMTFLKKIGREHSLMFWLQAFEFNKMPIERKLGCARRLFKDFLRSGAVHPVELPPEILKPIKKQLLKSKPPIGVYDDAMAYVVRMMTENEYKRFVRSYHYREAIQKKQAQDVSSSNCGCLIM